ncbi:MAG: type I 3-dehydroquinate dehydratase [Planctomycetota bacterium]|jgi:3-dehydroquinate dehydratase/shikimate dehydrogenase
MSTKFAIPVSADTIKTATRQIEAAMLAGAEIIELRIDYLKDLSVSVARELISAVRCSGRSAVLVTCRDSREGGIGKHPADLRIQLLIEAAKEKADFIDLEFQNYHQDEIRQKVQQELHKNSLTRLILSAHDFEGKFDNINDLLKNIRNIEPSAIPKLVYTAQHINDCFEAFDLLHCSDDNVIALCMGKSGLISRILAKKLGSFLTFASLDTESTTAPGQLTTRELKDLYRFDSINCETQLYGVIGSPVVHSASPAVFNACFAKAGMNELYLPLLIEGGANEFNSFLDNILTRPWLHFHGFSVTIPHKRNALDYLNNNGGFVEPLAERIGAVNTLVIDKDGKLSAYNSDYAGAMDAITDTLGIEREDLKNWPVTIIGAGGVARAIVAGLSDVGARVKIYNRTIEKGKGLAEEFDCEFTGLDDLPDLDTKLLINCTSLGMHPDVDNTPVPKEFLKEDMTVFDTVYNPAETRLLKENQIRN